MKIGNMVYCDRDAQHLRALTSLTDPTSTSLLFVSDNQDGLTHNIWASRHRKVGMPSLLLLKVIHHHHTTTTTANHHPRQLPKNADTNHNNNRTTAPSRIKVFVFYNQSHQPPTTTWYDRHHNDDDDNNKTITTTTMAERHKAGVTHIFSTLRPHPLAQVWSHTPPRRERGTLFHTATATATPRIATTTYHPPNRPQTSHTPSHESTPPHHHGHVKGVTLRDNWKPPGAMTIKQPERRQQEPPPATPGPTTTTERQ
jgi:hypothetical protein